MARVPSEVATKGINTHMRDQDFQTDYYETLGVSSDATLDEIRREYQRLLVAWDSHPSTADDAIGAKSRIERAWEVLREPNLRVEYDRWHMRSWRKSATGKRRSIDELVHSRRMQGTVALKSAVQFIVTNAAINGIYAALT